jgi:hypothetical protein
MKQSFCGTSKVSCNPCIFLSIITQRANVNRSCACAVLISIIINCPRQWACLDGGVSVSLKQTNTKTNTFHPNTCVSLVFVGTNTP